MATYALPAGSAYVAIHVSIRGTGPALRNEWTHKCSRVPLHIFRQSQSCVHSVVAITAPRRRMATLNVAIRGTGLCKKTPRIYRIHGFYENQYFGRGTPGAHMWPFGKAWLAPCPHEWPRMHSRHFNLVGRRDISPKIGSRMLCALAFSPPLEPPQNVYVTQASPNWAVPHTRFAPLAKGQNVYVKNAPRPWAAPHTRFAPSAKGQNVYVARPGNEARFDIHVKRVCQRCLPKVGRATYTFTSPAGEVNVY